MILCLTPWVNPPIALFSGILLTNTIGNPFWKFNQRASKLLLQLSVVGLGFGMNLYSAIEASKDGLLLIVGSILVTLALGLLFGKLFKLNKEITLLISSGTAICGGSAIAAVSPAIDAEEKDISVSLGTVFILNAVALMIFPLIGHHLELGQRSFGLWAAIAIHDTSSVVGAAQVYGEEALHMATTVKLSRALFIFPLLLFIIGFDPNKKFPAEIPWFIFGFIIAMMINTYLPALETVNGHIAYAAKKMLTLTLFLIGAGLTKEIVVNVGWKPLVMGVILWLFISVASLVIIMFVDL